MDTVVRISSVLTYAEKYTILKLWGNGAPIDVRIKFIKEVLVGRLKWQIRGWDIMEYNLHFQVICNRLINDLNIML
jgi:hypothetical protein